MKTFFKYFLLTLFLIIIFWYIGRSNLVNTPKRSAEFLNKATIFYNDPSKRISLTGPEEKDSNITRIVLEQRSSVTSLVKNLKNFYSLSQEELAAHLSQLKEEKKRLELSLAYEDVKLDPSFIMEPELRITLAIYLDISPEELSEKNWVDAEIPATIWASLVTFSQSNDFRILLRNEQLSKEEITQRISHQ